MPSQRGFVGAMFQGEKGEERRDVVGRGIWEWEAYPHESNYNYIHMNPLKSRFNYIMLD